jgi:hypothetical protein
MLSGVGAFAYWRATRRRTFNPLPVALPLAVDLELAD